MKTPKSDPCLYANCLNLIARGLHATMTSEDSISRVKDAIEAANTLMALLETEVKP